RAGLARRFLVRVWRRPARPGGARPRTPRGCDRSSFPRRARSRAPRPRAALPLVVDLRDRGALRAEPHHAAHLLDRRREGRTPGAGARQPAPRRRPLALRRGRRPRLALVLARERAL